jgi:hypothetical protein
MWVGGLAIEAAGYLLPTEGWLSAFVAWGTIFWLFYHRTRPTVS